MSSVIGVCVAVLVVLGCSKDPDGGTDASETNVATGDMATEDRDGGDGDDQGPISDDMGPLPDQRPPMVDGSWCVDTTASDLTTATGLGGHGDTLHIIGECDGAACWLAGDVGGGTFESSGRNDSTEASYLQIDCHTSGCMAITANTAATSDGSTWTDLATPDIAGASFTAVGVTPEAKMMADDDGNVWWQTDGGDFQTAALGQIRDFVSHRDAVLWAVGDRVWSASNFLWEPFQDFTDQRWGAATAENIYLTAGRGFIHWNEGFTNNLTASVELGPVAAFDGAEGDIVYVPAGRLIVTYVDRDLVPVEIGNEPESAFVEVAFAGGTAWAVTENGALYRASESCE